MNDYLLAAAAGFLFSDGVGRLIPPDSKIQGIGAVKALVAAVQAIFAGAALFFAIKGMI